jgi:MFS family permease
LTAVRVLQGIGGAMMVPVGRLVVLRGTAKSDLISAIAYLTWPALAAPIIAPVLGGLLTTYASWRWIFVINLPLGVAALVITLRIVPNLREAGHVGLDWRGFLLTGAGITTLVYGLEVVTYGKVDWAVVLLAVAAGLLLIFWAVRHLRRAQHPLLDLDIFRIPTFRVTNLGGSLFRLGIGATPFLLPLMFQDAFGWTPVKSGLVVIAVFVGNMGIKPFTTPILRRWGFRTVLVGAGVAAGLTIGLCATFTAGTPLALIALVLMASGVFRSIGFTAYNTIVFADVSAGEVSNANTLSSTIQQLTMGLAVALGAVALQAGSPLARAVGADSSPTRPFSAAFLLIGALPILGAVESARLKPHAGSTINVR